MSFTLKLFQEEAAAKRVRLAREHDQLDRPADDEVLGLDLVQARCLHTRRRERREAEPPTIARDEGSAGARRRKHHVRETQLDREVTTLAGGEEDHAREPRTRIYVTVTGSPMT